MSIIVHDYLVGEKFIVCMEQGLQILLMSGVSVTSASQILESYSAYKRKYCPIARASGFCYRASDFWS